jgi:O-methyltransferase domain
MLSSAVIVDMPSVVQICSSSFTGPQHVPDPAYLQRVHWVAADFFTEPQLVPAGDLFILSRIIHDWDEAHVRQLLGLVHHKLPLGGAVLICEMLLDDSGLGPPNALLQSLSMLVGWHGRERTLAQYEAQLTAAGFSRVQGKKTGAYLDAILAFK